MEKACKTFNFNWHGNHPLEGDFLKANDECYKKQKKINQDLIKRSKTELFYKVNDFKSIYTTLKIHPIQDILISVFLKPSRISFISDGIYNSKPIYFDCLRKTFKDLRIKYELLISPCYLKQSFENNLTYITKESLNSTHRILQNNKTFKGRINENNRFIRRIVKSGNTYMLLSQHLSLSKYISFEHEIIYYLSLIEKILRNSKSNLIIQAHPRDTDSKLDFIRLILKYKNYKNVYIIPRSFSLPIELINLSEINSFYGTISTSLVEIKNKGYSNIFCVNSNVFRKKLRNELIKFSKLYELNLDTLNIGNQKECFKSLFIIHLSFIVQSKKIVVYGYGKNGQELLKILKSNGINATYIIENNSKIHTNNLFLKQDDFMKLKDLKQYFIIFSCSAYDSASAVFSKMNLKEGITMNFINLKHLTYNYN
jgi:hypothetical protein